MAGMIGRLAGIAAIALLMTACGGGDGSRSGSTANDALRNNLPQATSPAAPETKGLGSDGSGTDRSGEISGSGGGTGGSGGTGSAGGGRDGAGGGTGSSGSGSGGTGGRGG